MARGAFFLSAGAELVPRPRWHRRDHVGYVAKLGHALGFGALDLAALDLMLGRVAKKIAGALAIRKNALDASDGSGRQARGNGFAQITGFEHARTPFSV